jgi:hypothetical protein
LIAKNLFETFPGGLPCQHARSNHFATPLKEKKFKIHKNQEASESFKNYQFCSIHATYSLSQFYERVTLITV